MPELIYVEQLKTRNYEGIDHFNRNHPQHKNTR